MKSGSFISFHSSLMFFKSKFSPRGGIKGAVNFFSYKSYQGKSRSHAWFFNSCDPPLPRRFYGFLYINLLIKSAASRDHPLGTSPFFI
jgi:hypothetical protein